MRGSGIDGLISSYIMLSYSQEKGAPRLLMEFSRNEQIPKLISINDVNRKDTRNRLLMQARNQAQQMQHPKVDRSEDTSLLRESLLNERDDNQELRVVVKELTKQLQKLKEVNEGLIVRIKEVETAYRNLRGDLQRTHEQDRRKLKNSIYEDVEEYVKVTVQRMTLNLKNQKMNPSLQDKLERFMAELMEINSVSVEQLVRQAKGQEIKFETISKATNSRRADRYLTELSASKHLSNRQQYASIMQRLVGDSQMSKSYAGVAMGSASQDAKLRTVYATTPQKRKRIFQ